MVAEAANHPVPSGHLGGRSFPNRYWRGSRKAHGLISTHSRVVRPTYARYIKGKHFLATFFTSRSKSSEPHPRIRISSPIYYTVVHSLAHIRPSTHIPLTIRGR